MLYVFTFQMDVKYVTFYTQPLIFIYKMLAKTQRNEYFLETN